MSRTDYERFVARRFGAIHARRPEKTSRLLFNDDRFAILGSGLLWRIKRFWLKTKSPHVIKCPLCGADQLMHVRAGYNAINHLKVPSGEYQSAIGKGASQVTALIHKDASVNERLSFYRNQGASVAVGTKAL